MPALSPLSRRVFLCCHQRRYHAQLTALTTVARKSLTTSSAGTAEPRILYFLRAPSLSACLDSLALYNTQYRIAFLAATFHSLRSSSTDAVDLVERIITRQQPNSESPPGLMMRGYLSLSDHPERAAHRVFISVWECIG